jgi:DNA-binding winged helix-turn-helix (wHTH) protein
LAGTQNGFIGLILSMIWKPLSFLLAGCLAILLLAFVIRKPAKSEYDKAREEMVMRKIAHEVLRYTGDSSSVLPSILHPQINEYLIPFSTGFAFKPDSLVPIIDTILARYGMPSDYMVHVSVRSSGKVVFGYAMSENEQTSIVPCLGREQPAMPYTIQLQFPEKPAPVKGYWMACIGLLLAGGGWLFYRRQQLRKQIPVSTEQEPATQQQETGQFRLGQFLFRPAQQLLIFAEQEIILTSKEAKLLQIFAEQPNTVIDRNRLQKEVWEDEGVIVGRSLDVFISRLRKKLEADPAVKLSNIHGKGYRLELGGEQPPSV